jgi:pyrimidine-nucleoside phosphorylase
MALVKAQGGDERFVDDTDRFSPAKVVRTVVSPRGGFVKHIDARIVGETVVALGGGRAQKGDPIDHAVGVVVHHKVGDAVEQGGPLFTVHAAGVDAADQAVERVMQAHAFSHAKVEPLPLFYRTLRS